jgi:hypothetical protein
MEQMSDDELRRALREWRAPPAPPTLEGRVFGGARKPWWNWLFTGSVRIPVPVCAVLILVLAGLAAFSVRRQPSVQPASGAAFAEFQPVKELKPRIIRSAYEKP